MKTLTQVKFDFEDSVYEKKDIVKNIQILIEMHKTGRLGGEIMPEDARPLEIDIHSSDNYQFLTLPMALNYQRNSYKLWESAAKTYLDPNTKDVFNPRLVTKMSLDSLKEKLLKHKVALQPVKHIDTWRRLCNTITELFDGDIRILFEKYDNDVVRIREVMQEIEKKRFPYLSGHKIFNYWLHVMEIYTPLKLKNRIEITVAPDTHIIQGSLRLGLIKGNIEEISQNRIIVSDEWKKVLANTEISPIDIHTPLWLWSKRGFPEISDNA